MPKAPAYRSYRWISQDWRYIKLVYQMTIMGKKPDDKDIRVSYDKRCGSVGGRTEGGRTRLCLPKKVIEKLLKTKKGKKALIDQAEKKLFSEKKKVSWNSIVKSSMIDFQKKTKIKNNPKKTTKPKKRIIKN